MLAVLLLDMILTLVGQPASYWRDPATAEEFNPLVAWFMHRGLTITVVSWLSFSAASFALVTFLPGRAGSITLLAFILGAFTASSGWLVYRFRLGMPGLYVYSFAVAATYVRLLDGKRPNPPPGPTPTSVTAPKEREPRQP